MKKTPNRHLGQNVYCKDILHSMKANIYSYFLVNGLLLYLKAILTSLLENTVHRLMIRIFSVCCLCTGCVASTHTIVNQRCGRGAGRFMAML